MRCRIQRHGMDIDRVRSIMSGNDLDKIIRFRKGVAQLEADMAQIDGHLGPDPFPLKHSFAPGLYAREIIAPQGMLIVTRIHKTEHFVFILKGRVSVLTETGIERLQAPCMIRSKVGAKRVIYTHEETVWVNVYANSTDSEDMAELEGMVFAKSYDDIELPYLELLELKEA